MVKFLKADSEHINIRNSICYNLNISLKTLSKLRNVLGDCDTGGLKTIRNHKTLRNIGKRVNRAACFNTY